MKPFLVFSLFLLPFTLLAQSDTLDLNELLGEDDSLLQYSNPYLEVPFGEENLMRYISKIIYPEKAIDEEIQGIVWITFRIDSAGKTTDLRVARGVHPLLDDAALNHIRKMPPWQPAPPPGVQYAIPIRFMIM